MAKRNDALERNLERKFTKIAETRAENLGLLLSALQDVRQIKGEQQRKMNRVLYTVIIALHGEMTGLLVSKGIITGAEGWGLYAAALAMIEKAQPNHPDTEFCRKLFADGGLLEPIVPAEPGPKG